MSWPNASTATERAAAAGARGQQLELCEIQGNIVPGFNKDHQAFVLVSFSTPAAGRAWLQVVSGEIASAAQLFAFKQAFKFATEERRGGLPVLSARWTNVALTFAGLQQLLPRAEGEAFPATFKTGRLPFAESQADDAAVHAMLLLAADRADDLGLDLGRHLELLSRCGLRQVHLFQGNALPGAERGHEHFGFKDGVSQPVLAGTPDALRSDQPPVPAGEFVLGEPNAAGRPAVNGPRWSRHGSYLAFVQLEQHVAAFREATRREAERLRLRPEQVAAEVIGRHQSGAALSEPPPRVSHIGRAHPRWLPPNVVARHRVLRRGIPYGRPLPADAPEDGQPRGLLFVAYQADLAEQFEQVWLRWLNGGNFPGQGAGADALTGQSRDDSRPAVIATPGHPTGGLSVRLPRFVTPHYGAYFFAPSLSAIRWLAGQSADLQNGRRE